MIPTTATQKGLFILPGDDASEKVERTERLKPTIRDRSLTKGDKALEGGWGTSHATAGRPATAHQPNLCDAGHFSGVIRIALQTAEQRRRTQNRICKWR